MLRYLAYGAAALVLVGAVAWSFQAPRYEAFALLQVAETPDGVLSQSRERGDAFDVFKRTQMQLIVSGPVLRRAVREPAVSELPTIKRQDAAVAWLSRRIRVDYPGGGEIMRVALKGDAPQDLVKIVDGIVKSYFNEVVHNSQLDRFAQEDRLKAKYGDISKEYARKAEALNKSEQVHQVESTFTGEIRRKLAVAELDDAVSTRNYLRRELLENELQSRLQRAHGAKVPEAQTAEDRAASQADDVPPVPAADDRVLDSLQQQRAFLQEKLAQSDKRIQEAAKSFDGFDQYSASVAMQREELFALKQIMTRLKSQIDLTEVERLSQERVQLLDGASAAPLHTEGQRYAVLGGAVLASLALCFAGWAGGRKRRLRNAAQTQ